ncbi:MAG: cache domain-containing protein, partial [Kangiellaceae bacterium]|nr:cache domain-containing protein [Kangiellaceae bacterium]
MLKKLTIVVLIDLIQSFTMPKSATDFKIAKKLSLIYIISLTGIIITLLLFYNVFKNTIFQEKHSQTKSLSDAALAVVKHFHSLAQQGAISTTQAKTSALQTIEAMRFNQLGYYWINDSQGILLMHPFMTKLVGVDVRPVQDKSGIFMFQEFIDMAKSNRGGFVEYYWPKPNSSFDSENTSES